ncbi:MAG: hypothetical protein AB7Q91_07295 [Phycisphaerales bacterium]
MVESSSVIVLCYEDHVDSGIARALLRNRWRLIDGRSGPPAIKMVMLAHPLAVIVQVPALHASDVPLATIRRLARHWNPTCVLGVAGPDAGDVEVMVRQSGADCFLPHPCSPDALEQMLESMVPGVTRVGSVRAAGRRATGTSDATARAGPNPGAYSRNSRRTL